MHTWTSPQDLQGSPELAFDYGALGEQSPSPQPWHRDYFTNSLFRELKQRRKDAEKKTLLCYFTYTMISLLP